MQSYFHDHIQQGFIAWCATHRIATQAAHNVGYNNPGFLQCSIEAIYTAY